MKHIITAALALCLLLTGCGTAAAGAPDADRSLSNQAEPLSAPDPAPATPTMAVKPVGQRAESSESGRGSIVKTLSGEGIDQIDIFAELCAVVLEKSAGDELEVVFSFPEAAARNYEKHFELGVIRQGSAAHISTDYEDGRWDTAFEPIRGFDGERYRETAVLTVRLPEGQYEQIRLQMLTAGGTLDLSGVDASAVDIQISTGDVMIRTDRAYENLSVSHKVGNVTLRAPELGGELKVSSRIGVFTLSLPADPRDVALEIRYDKEPMAAGDKAVYVLPVTWDAAVSGQVVRCERGDGSRRILVANRKYGVFAAAVDGIATAEPAFAR